ncbi:G protein-regulated inducer of neurite outgrowth 1 [Dunckerocampus dactyliophorus]|uniref:G protein-regulated inducer of neurite outgrowth 1 n=1 Tax=Dunckerocampus dactyliophorus TaxID=161453 RepID=UPI0024060CBF|nr:G protein-regulated inducer of neurite outgrowth 1 [Dunckerocampus dactyliophorus]
METSYNPKLRKDVKSKHQIPRQAGFADSLGSKDANGKCREEPNFNLSFSLTSPGNPCSKKDDGKLTVKQSQEDGKPEVSLTTTKASGSHRAQQLACSPGVGAGVKTQSVRTEASGASMPKTQSGSTLKTNSKVTLRLKMQSIKKQDGEKDTIKVQHHREDSGCLPGQTSPATEEPEPVSTTASVSAKPQMKKMDSVPIGRNSPTPSKPTFNSKTMTASKDSQKSASGNSCGSKGSFTGYSSKTSPSFENGTRENLDCETDIQTSVDNPSVKPSPCPKSKCDSFKKELTRPPSVTVSPCPLLVSRSPECRSSCPDSILVHLAPLAASSPKTRTCVALTTQKRCTPEPEAVADLTKSLTLDSVDRTSLTSGVAPKGGQWKLTAAGGMKSQEVQQGMDEAGRPPQNKVCHLRDENVNIALSYLPHPSSAHPERLNPSEMLHPQASEGREVGVQVAAEMTERSVSTSPSLPRGAPCFSLIDNWENQSCGLTSPTVSLCCVPAAQSLRKHVCKIDIELSSQVKEESANSIMGGDKEVRMQAGQEVGAKPREVAKDEQGMTWEVYGASVDLESQTTAIQSHLESKIRKQAKHIQSLRRFIRKHNRRKKRKRKKDRKKGGRMLGCCCMAPSVED